MLAGLRDVTAARMKAQRRDCKGEDSALLAITALVYASKWCWDKSEAVGQRHTEVFEARIDDFAVVAHVDGNHRAIVETERERNIFQREAESQCADRAEEEIVVIVVVIKTEAAAKAAPEFPGCKAWRPVGPLADVPVVDRRSTESLVEVEDSGSHVKEVLLVEVVLIFKIHGRPAEVYTDGVRGALGETACRCHNGKNGCQEHLFHKCSSFRKLSVFVRKGRVFVLPVW